MFSKILSFKARHQVWFAIVIIIGVVAVWRGVWGLLDLMGEHFFADNPTLDFMVSILIGLAILGATHYVVKELM